MSRINVPAVESATGATAEVYAEVKKATDFRWALKTAVDTHANTVTYAYACDGVPNYYIDTISYNGNSIKFYREARTDILSYATGAGLGTWGWLLKTIDVTVGVQRARAYALTYDVGVKILSFQLILMSLFLLAPDFPRLSNVLLLNRPAGVSSEAPPSSRFHGECLPECVLDPLRQRLRVAIASPRHDDEEIRVVDLASDIEDF